MFFSIVRIGFAVAKFARRAFVATKMLERVGDRLQRLRPHVAEMEKQTKKINRDARGVQESFNELANASARLEQSASQLGRSGVIDVRIRTNAHQVADELERLEAEIDAGLQEAAQLAVFQVERDAKHIAAVDTGLYRSSIFSEVEPLGSAVMSMGSEVEPMGAMGGDRRRSVVLGRVASGVEYARFQKKERSLEAALEMNRASIERLFQQRLNAVVKRFQ